MKKKQTCEILKKNSHNKVNEIYNNLLNTNPVSRRNIIQATRQAIFYCNGENKKELSDWIKKLLNENKLRYNSHLYSESNQSLRKIPQTELKYSKEKRC